MNWLTRPRGSKRGVSALATLGLALLAAGSLGLASCGQDNAAAAGKAGQADAAKGAARAVPIVAATVTAGEVPIEIKTFGMVQANATVAVKAQTSELLQTVHFEEGQAVRQGDLLFTLDARPVQSALKQAEANLARNQVLARNAEQEAVRIVALRKSGVASPSEVEKAQADADALQAAIRADQAALENLKLQLEHCYIRAPLDGRAGEIQVDAGNLVKSADQTLVVINRTRPIDIFFSLPQNNLSAVRRYMARGKLTVQAAVPGETEVGEEVGELNFIDNSVDQTTGTIRLGAVFENPAERLWPGQYLQLTLTLARQKDAVVVPAEALQVGRDGKYVFVIKADQTVEMRLVTAGRTVEGRTVIEQGLVPGEQVVVDGQMKLVPGSKVENKPSAAARLAAPRGGPPAAAAKDAPSAGQPAGSATGPSADSAGAKPGSKSAGQPG